MKKLIVIAAITLFCFKTFAQDNTYSNWLINKYKTESARAFSKSNTTHDKHWLSNIIAEGQSHYNLLNDEAKSLIKKITARPTLANEKIYKALRFDIHYTTKGVDSVSVTDANSNSVPDYVETIATVMDTVYNRFVRLNYAVPPNDQGQGGSPKLDLYLQDLSVIDPTLDGHAVPETNVGDNPNTPNLKEYDAYACWMALRSNYGGTLAQIETRVKSVGGHEYMHVINIAYSVTSSSWFKEMTATWSEDLIFEKNDNNFQYLQNMFSYPDVALNAETKDGQIMRPYASWIFMKYITDHTSNDLGRRFFERVILAFDVPLIDTELKENWNSSFEKMYENFIIANYFMTSDAAYEPYTYKRALDYRKALSTFGGLSYETKFKYIGNKYTYKSDLVGNSQLMRLGTDYFTVLPDRNFNITFTAVNPAAPIEIILIKNNSSTKKFEIQRAVTEGNNKVIRVGDKANFTNFVIAVIRYDKSNTKSTSEQYSFVVDQYKLSIEEHEKQPAYITPNLLTDKATLTLPENYNNKVSLTIFDNMGKIVSYLPEVSNNQTITRSAMASGIYFYAITDRNQQMISRGKLVVQ